MQHYDTGGDGCCCVQCVRTNQVGIVEDLGQFNRILAPGLHCIYWPLQCIVGRLSLRIQQLDVVCETKTKDNVFVIVQVAVQYRVLQDKAYDAFYRLTDPRSQIQSYVFDVVRYVYVSCICFLCIPIVLTFSPLLLEHCRSTVPKMQLDDAFASKDDIAGSVLTQLQHVMREYGYEIKNTLVTDLSPDAKVKASMNEINAARRLREAASHKAEADKTKQVKHAEAEAEARYLSGLGVARQRKAIVEGLQHSVSEFSTNVKGATPKDVMDILLLSQYFDTLSAIGANQLFLEHDPATVAVLQESVNKSFLKTSTAAASLIEKHDGYGEIVL
jgi:regulator of protease activity HflC (stomatin/prohibitin superfamily)